MASLPIIGAASTSFAAQGKNAELIAKGSLAKAGLRTRSKKDVITGKRIPGSSSNRFLQLIGQEKKEDAENTIREAEKESSKKKGMIFVFNLLLQTLEKIKRQRDEALAHPLHYTEEDESLKRLIENLNLEEKECRLLYIIAYSSALTEDDAPPDMRDLLERIKHDFGLPEDSSRVPTIWSEMHYMPTWGVTNDDLLKRIQYVESYIDLWNKKVATAERNALDRVVNAVAAGRKEEYGPKYSSSIQRYDNVDILDRGVTGPYRNLAKNWITDTEEHKKQVKEKVKRRRTEKIRRDYFARRRADAIRREGLTPEQAADLPADYGRALNTTNGGRRRKKKTRKKRGGMEAPPTPPRPPKDNDVGTNKYVPGHVGFHPPQQLPHFMLPPPVNPEPVTRRRDRRGTAIEMERAPLDMRIPEEERDVRVNTANQRYRRSQRSHLRNFTGDVLESCTGSRCGLGGSRRRKSRKKKKTCRRKKMRRKKKTRRRKKMRRKKNRKRRTKKKSRRKKR